MRIILFACLFLLSCSAEMKSGPSYALLINHTDQEPLLEGIQGKIYNSFVQSMIQQSDEGLQEIEQQLAELYQNNEQNLIQYWRGYACYYQAIYHIQTQDKVASEAAIDKGIQVLKSIDGKNSEDFALLAMLQSFSIQFKGAKAMFISNAVNKNISKAIQLDPENIRAHYIGGSSDYYTPEKYGGGKKVERYLRKAISLPVQKTPNAYLPSWGKEEAYEMLIKFYLRKERTAEAKKYFKEANQLYPESYLINQLASKLID